MLSLIAKAASTAAWLVHRHLLAFARVERHATAFWRTTKASALTLCASAALLCRGCGDHAGEAGFAGLLVVACGLVLAMARRRMTQRAPASAS